MSKHKKGHMSKRTYVSEQFVFGNGFSPLPFAQLAQGKGNKCFLSVLKEHYIYN